MIIALVLNAPEQLADALPQPAQLLDLEHESVIERVTRTVLRGPFGVTIVASSPPLAAEIKSELNGYAVQHVEAPGDALLIVALKFAQDFRARWEKAMAAAGKRFAADEKSEGDSELQEDWSKHKSSADVKVRSLARSFERDGVMLFYGDQPLISPEIQAQVIERFCTPRKDETPQTMRPVTQAVYSGERGFPVILNLDAVKDVLALKPGADLEKWLLDNLNRVQDVKIDNPSAGWRIRTDADYQRVLKSVCGE